VYYCYMWIYIAYLIPCEVLQCSNHSDALDSIKVAPYVLIPLIWLIILIEHFGCNESKYLENMGDIAFIQDFIDSMRSAAPSVVFIAKCYHYETRYRTITERDSRGNTTSRTESYQEEVVTHTDVERYEYSLWDDVSSTTLEGIRANGVTRIAVSKSIDCGNDVTTQDFDAKYSSFKERNRHKDLYMDAFYDTSIPGFAEKIAVTSEKDGKIPSWMNVCLFFLTTVLFMSWPYRWLFQYNTGKTEYMIEKRIFIGNNETSQEIPTCASFNKHLVRYLVETSTIEVE